MTTVVVLEDEAPARQRLEELLRKLEPGIAIAAALASVEQAHAWFAANPAPDLVLADIQLSDGLSFEVFSRTASAPVIFCTAYDEHAMEAMAAGGIEYLVKPIKESELARALAHYRRLEAHFAQRVERVATAIARPPRRLLARLRDRFVTLPVDDIAYFVVDDKLVDVVARDGRRMRVDRTLAELEAELDPAQFFRVNRQYLVAAFAVTGFRPFVKGKLLVDLEPSPRDEVIVSQELAPRFRAWLSS
jgi:DNA-binding LytR/AlgR family response regulator